LVEPENSDSSWLTQSSELRLGGFLFLGSLKEAFLFFSFPFAWFLSHILIIFYFFPLEFSA
jgi:hypothetical protein